MTAHYTGRERVMAVCRGEKPDRVPINIHVPTAYELAGFTAEECVFDPDKALTAQIKAHELFPSDMVNVPGDPFLPTNAAILAKAKFGEGVKPPLALEDKGNLAQLEVRDPRKSKLYSKYLEMCHKTQAVFKDAWISALLAAPWSIAVNGFRGVERLIYDTMDDPQFVHELLKVATDFCKARGDALIETGVDLLLAETSASCSVISPNIYVEFVHPYLKDVVDHFKNQGAMVDLHICGSTDPIVEHTTSLNVDIIDIDGPTSLLKTLKASQNRLAVRGNLAAELFSEGSREQIREAVRGCLETAAGAGKYILSPGCTIPHDSPMENIRAFWEAGLKYGQYTVH